MSDIFREIEDELRQEKFLKLWRGYGKYIVAIVALALLVIAGGIGWRAYHTAQEATESNRYFGAVALAQKDGQAAAATAFADLAADAAGGYRVLAGLQAAAAHIAAGDIPAAVKLYDALAVDRGVDRRYRDLAALLAVLHQMDTQPPQALEARLQPLLASNNPWRYTAGELMATLQLKSGDTAAAKQGFAALSDDAAAPAGLRARAAEMLAALGGGPAPDAAKPAGTGK